MSLFPLLALIAIVLLIVGLGFWGIRSARKPVELGARPTWGPTPARPPKFARHPGGSGYTPLAERNSRAL